TAQRAARARNRAVAVGAEDLDDGVGDRVALTVEHGAAEHDRTRAVREGDLVLLRIFQPEGEERPDGLPRGGREWGVGHVSAPRVRTRWRRARRPRCPTRIPWRTRARRGRG